MHAVDVRLREKEIISSISIPLDKFYTIKIHTYVCIKNYRTRDPDGIFFSGIKNTGTSSPTAMSIP